MKKVISTENLPIKMWLDNIEEGAVEQAKHLANLPFAFKHIAIMPDSHVGYGMPIGAVLATKDVVVPNAVGVDIGCGMCAVKTDLTEISLEALKKGMGKIRETVPVGFNHHKAPQGGVKDMRIEFHHSDIIAAQLEKAEYQIGTLGGGNHFIEIQKGSDGFIWVMVHSGSRNLGYTTAGYYDKKAKELNAKWFSSIPKEWELAFLPMQEPTAKDYINDMKFCTEFALRNRKLMMSRVLDAINAAEVEFVNLPHNYVTWENHFGNNVLVHRKGATSAKAGEIGIIPGSQGTKSYIVVGKGNKESFESCSHGSGRVMGRKQAQKNLNLEKEIELLDQQGILHAIRHKTDLDEAPSAYKDIQEVMKNQTDLIDIKVELSPLAVIKSSEGRD